MLPNSNLKMEKLGIYNNAILETRVELTIVFQVINKCLGKF